MQQVPPAFLMQAHTELNIGYSEARVQLLSAHNLPYEIPLRIYAPRGKELGKSKSSFSGPLNPFPPYQEPWNI